MSTFKTSNMGSSGLISQIDKKIKHLVGAKNDIEIREKKVSHVSSVTAHDLLGLDISEDLSKLKEIQRERLMEDLSLILNDKIKELEKKEELNEEKEVILTDLTYALNEKVFQLEVANKIIAEQKKLSDESNLKLQETVKKLETAENELKIERDWLADQVEKKSFEVLNTIDKLIRSEKSEQNQ